MKRSFKFFYSDEMALMEKLLKRLENTSSLQNIAHTNAGILKFKNYSLFF